MQEEFVLYHVFLFDDIEENLLILLFQIEDKLLKNNEINHQLTFVRYELLIFELKYNQIYINHFFLLFHSELLFELLLSIEFHDQLWLMFDKLK